MDKVANTYLLVNLVDNDFPKENCIWALLNDMFELKSKSPGAQFHLIDKLEEEDLDEVMAEMNYAL